MDDFLILLQAKLDEAKSIENLNGTSGDIATLQGKLNALQLQATLDPNAAQKLADDIGRLLNQKITISNINVDTVSGIKAGQQYGKQFNQGISREIKNNTPILNSFKESLKNIGMGFKEIDIIANKINKLGVQIETLNQTQSIGKKGILSVNIAGTDQYGQAIKLTQRYNIVTGELINTIDNVSTIQQKAGVSVNNFAKQQSQAVNNLTNQINQLNRAANDQNASRPIIDSFHLNTLSNAYNDIISGIERMKNVSSDTFIEEQNNVKTLISNYKSLVSEFRNAENVAIHMNGSDISSGIAQAQERLGKLKANASGFEQMTQTIRELDVAIEGVGDKSSLDNFLNQLKVAEAQLGRVKAETKAITQANKIQLSIETGGYESKVDSLIARTRQWTDANGNARISTDNLSLAFDKLLSASNAFSDNKTIANQQALIKAENELNIEIEKVTNSVRKRNAEFAKDATISSLHNQIQKFYDNNGAAHRKWGTQLKQMLSETASGAELTKERVTEIKAAFNGVASAAQQAGKVGKTWFQSFKDAAKFLTYWTSPTFITMKAIAEIKQDINTVKKLDTALVDLKKTTTMTGSELENFYYDSNKVAKQMGVATEKIINQASAWSRLGFSSEAMATKMAKYSSMFSSISPGLDLDSATNGLVSTMKAYSIGLDNADEVVDGIMSKINIIGNSKALNNSDIVDFLTRSSSALASANNSIEESIAMGEAIVEITRDAAGAGQVMKTTSMRIRGYDEELESYTEDLENLKGEIADLTKTAKTPGGISLFTDETKETYKSTYKILEEISGIWNDLTDKNQAQLLEVLAGKRNGQALAALISNFKSAQESMDLMANSAGNAEKEMSVIMDSLDFKLNRLSETGTSVAQNLFKRDDMKTVVDGLTSVMNVIDSLTSKLGLFGSIGLGAGIFAGVKNIGKTCECMDFKSSVLCFEYALHA